MLTLLHYVVPDKGIVDQNQKQDYGYGYHNVQRVCIHLKTCPDLLARVKGVEQ